jgi:hypothetical protein
VEALIEQLRASSGGNQFETFATKTESFVETIVDGRCDLRPGVREVTSTGVIFMDGTEVDTDALVFCTGFEPPSVPFLDVSVGLDRLYRSCFDPTHGETLAFIGFVRPPIGAIPPMSEMQAHWFAQLLSARVQLPAASAMEAETDEALAARQSYHRAVELVWSPRLLYKLYTSAFSAVQYRLRGPHADPAMARSVISHAPSHVRVVRFFDLAGAELARLARARHLEPRLTLIGRVHRSAKRVV